MERLTRRAFQSAAAAHLGTETNHQGSLFYAIKCDFPQPVKKFFDFFDRLRESFYVCSVSCIIR